MLWRKLTLRSNLEPQDLLGRLRAEIPQSIVSWNATPETVPVVGRFSTDSFVLKKTKSYTNPFETVLRGRVAAVGGGSDISCVIGPGRFVLVFFALWMLFAVLGAIKLGGLTWLMMLFGAAFVGWGLYSARNEATILLNSVAALAGGTAAM